MSDILDIIPGVVKLMGDVPVFGSDQKEHDERLYRTLDRMAQAAVTLNRKTPIQLKRSFISCLWLGKNDICPDPAKVRAISDMNAPENVAAVRKRLGLANHCLRFIPNMAEKTASSRQLVQKNAERVWTAAQERALSYLKRTIRSDNCVTKYDPQYPTIPSAEASSYGLGAVLMQLQPDKEQRPVVFVSRALTSTKMRHAKIESGTLT